MRTLGRKRAHCRTPQRRHLDPLQKGPSTGGIAAATLADDTVAATLNGSQLAHGECGWIYMMASVCQEQGCLWIVDVSGRVWCCMERGVRRRQQLAVVRCARTTTSESWKRQNSGWSCHDPTDPSCVFMRWHPQRIKPFAKTKTQHWCSGLTP